MKRLLKGGNVVSGEGWAQEDVLIEDGIIKRVGADLTCEMKNVDAVVDVSGKWLFPGFIDVHTHFDLAVAGTVTADNFETGTKAAISGGTTTILDFCTQYKGESLQTALDNWHKKADGVSSCDYGFHLAISDWNDDICEELAKVVTEGVSSFKLYMTYDDMILDDEAIYEVLARLKELGGIAGVHCENSGIIKAMVKEAKAAGHMDTSAHSATRPAVVEAEAISRLLKIAAIVDTPVIIVHLSSGAGYQEVKYARERGQEVYLETCPQYLLLDESKYRLPDFEGGRYIIAPPLRRVEDQTRLWNALRKDHIHTISTDHCSFTLAQKEMGKEDFTKIPGGMAGVETRPVLIYTYGVLTGKLTIEQMCRLLSENPAKLYGMYPQKGCIAPGSDADIVVWEPDEAWTLTKDNQVANVDYQAYEGFEVKGKAEKVYLHGELVVEDGRVVKEFEGRYVRRKTRTEID
ncbi:MAG: dihydropyrimidinase [Hungatella hathewayi]|nr:dihydropyrimidinase [Hungatella hathewayi]